MPDAPLVEIKNATIYRGDTRVFDNLNATIGHCEPVVILGPNGSGKTTLLKAINREIYPVHKEGSYIKILGKTIWNVWELRSHIGIVSHDLQTRYHGDTTGLEVVLSGFHSSIGIHGSLASRITDEQKERAHTTLQSLGVGTFATTPMRKMSTGQQRRCLLARALVHNPQTLILDEPTAGLDLSASFEYMARIRALAKAGKNIVLVTHQLNEIPPDIDRVILLRRGVILADGRKQDVLTEDNLREAYEVEARVAHIGGYYLAYPAKT